MTDPVIEPYDEKDGRPELAKKYERTKRWGTLTTFLIISYFVVATAILVWNAYVGSQTRATLVDCTTPDGDCAKESQQSTAKAIDQLITAGKLGDVATQRVVVLSEACADDPDVRKEADLDKRVDLLLACVTEKQRATK